MPSLAKNPRPHAARHKRAPHGRARKSGIATIISAATAASDAVALLEGEHREMEKLFARYEDAGTAARKGALALRICLELRVHMRIEDEILYPPAYAAIEDDLIDEALVEHESARNLIKQIEVMRPGDPLFDAKVKVLSEHIEHHVKEEEEDIFPKLRSSDIDLTALGEQMRRRRTQLLSRLSGHALKR